VKTSFEQKTDDGKPQKEGAQKTPKGKKKLREKRERLIFSNVVVVLRKKESDGP